MKMHDKVAKYIVDYAGGRFVYLILAVRVITNKPRLSEDEVIKLIKKELLGHYVYPALMSVNRNGDDGRFVVKEMLKANALPPTELTRGLKKDKANLIEDTVTSLVNSNVFRYDSSVLHNKLVFMLLQQRTVDSSYRLNF